MVDLKCSIVNDSQCWFCEDLCDFCLQRPAGVTSCASLISDKTIKLMLCSDTCSDTCSTLVKTNPSKQLYAVSPDKRVYCNESDGSELNAEGLHIRFGSHCAPVLPSHEEILHLYSITTDGDNSFLLEETSLCYGDFVSPKDLVRGVL